MQIEFIAVPDEKEILGAVAVLSFDGELSHAAAAMGDFPGSGLCVVAPSPGRGGGRARGQVKPSSLKPHPDEAVS